MAAFSLTIGEGEAEGQHFMKVPLDMVLWNQLIPLTNALKDYLKVQRHECVKCHSICTSVAFCESEVYRKLDILKSSVNSEAGLRFAIGDPIAMMLCSHWNLKVCTNNMLVLAYVPLTFGRTTQLCSKIFAS